MRFKNFLFPVINAFPSVFNKRSSKSDHILALIESWSTMFPITVRFSKIISDESLSVSLSKPSMLHMLIPVTLLSI